MGGTIAGTAADAGDNVGYRAAQVGVSELLQALPTLAQALGGRELVSEQVAQVDSKDLGFAHWLALARRASHYLAQPEVAGLVITHGTDTLEETAFFLSQVLPAQVLAVKPVVLTCAMRPASSLAPDGPQNILDAVAVAVAPGARGVVVVCAGVVHAALDVQKVHPYRLNAFDSGDAGPLGYVEEGVARLAHGWPVATAVVPLVDLAALSEVAAWPRVEVLMSHVGASGAMVRALCAPVSGGDAPVRGLVVAGTGNGTIHADLEAALRQAQAAGVRVVRATRCARGRLVHGGAVQAFPSFDGLSPVKARIALLLTLLA